MEELTGEGWPAIIGLDAEGVARPLLLVEGPRGADGAHGGMDGETPAIVLAWRDSGYTPVKLNEIDCPLKVITEDVLLSQLLYIVPTSYTAPIPQI